MMVNFVGAGPGAVDLITVRGMELIKRADVIIYAGSLVNPGLLDYARAEAEIYNSAHMTLEEVLEVMKKAVKEGREVVRLHTGEPSIYGAVREQMDALDREGISYASCPGVSACFGAAADMNLEYTLPEVSQTLIITRLEGRTGVPERESMAALARHRASMAIYLSAGMTDRLSMELIRGGYPHETPAAIVYKATWDDEKCLICTVGTLHETAVRENITKTATVLVGDAVAHHSYSRSRLYDPNFTTGFRKGKDPDCGDSVYGTDNTDRGHKGKIYVTGIGPGDFVSMTVRGREALEASDVIVGYRAYVDIVRSYYPGKEFYENGMRGETERCEKCVEYAKQGKTVALICSGDAGVYGMASPLLEIALREGFEDVEIIPGVTAALSGAAELGAPLSDDFCVISLSDLLTPWELIEKRLLSAAEGEFCIALYNPSSKKRAGHLKKACGILMSYLPGDTACGYVRNIGREGFEKKICTLKELQDENADMFSTVFIGNSKTLIADGKLITPRGYKL